MTETETMIQAILKAATREVLIRLSTTRLRRILRELTR